MKSLSVIFKFLFISILIIGCQQSKKSSVTQNNQNLEDFGGFIPTPSTVTTQTENCASQISAVVVVQSGSQSFELNQPIEWRIIASGGCPAYRVTPLQGNNAGPQLFTGANQFSITTHFAVVQTNFTPVFKIEGLSSEGDVEQTVLAFSSTPITIVPAAEEVVVPPSFACQLVVMEPTITVVVDANNQPVNGVPPVSMAVNTPGVMSKLKSIVTTSYSGSDITFTGANYSVDSETHQFLGFPQRRGQVSFKATVAASADLSVERECFGSVFVNVIYPADPPPPEAPSCSIEVSTNSPKQGQAFTATILVSGLADSAQINNTNVTLDAPEISITPANSGIDSISGMVMGPGGVGNCDLQYDARPNDHVIFLSSQRYNGNLGGLDGAASICENLAQNAGLRADRPWKALLSSDSVDARNYIGLEGLIYDVVGNVIYSRPTIDGNSDRPVFHNEYGAFISGLGDQDTWTGTNQNGLRHSGKTCSSWTTSNKRVEGIVAESQNNNTKEWLDDTDDDCDELRRLYCISM